MGPSTTPSHADIPVTDDDGRFQFPHCEPGSSPITAWKPGWAPQQMMVSISTAPLHVEIKMNRGREIRFQVLDSKDRPVRNANVRPDTWREFRNLHFVHETFGYDFPQTDANGIWTWKWAPQDEINFNVYKKGYRGVSNISVAASDTTHHVQLQPALTVTGSIVDSETGLRVHKAKVTPVYRSIRFNYQGTKDATNGSYAVAFDRELKKPPELRFEAPGYEPMVAPVNDNNRNDVELNVKMKKAAHRRFVIVKNQDGIAEPNARVIIATKEKRAYIRANLQSRQHPEMSLTTAADGRAELPVLNESFTVFAVSRTGYAQKTVHRGSTNSDNIELQTIPTSRVEGVLIKNGKPLIDEPITLSWGGDPGGSFAYVDFDTQTDANGQFVFPQVPTASIIRVFHAIPKRHGRFVSHHPAASATCTPTPGKTIKLTLGRSGKYSLRGKMAYDDGNETSVNWGRCRARLTHTESESEERAIRYVPTATIPLQPDGSFYVHGLDAGRHTLNFHFGDGRHDEEEKSDLPHGYTSRSFTIGSDENQTSVDLGTLTVYPARPSSKRTAKPGTAMLPVDINRHAAINRQALSSKTFRLSCITKSLDGTVIPNARVTVWYADNGPTQPTTLLSKSSGHAIFPGIPNYGAWLFAEADGFRFHGQYINTPDAKLVVDTEIVLIPKNAPTRRRKLQSPSVSLKLRNTAKSTLESFSTRVMSGKVQHLRFKTEHFLAQFAPQLGMKAHATNTIDFHGFASNPARHTRWHNVHVHYLAAMTLVQSDVKAAEEVIEQISVLPSRCRVYAMVAAHVPELHRPTALDWLRRAEAFANEPGKEMLALAGRLAYIGTAYRKHGAHDDALRVLRLAADEASYNMNAPTKKHLFEFNKSNIARHLAAYDLSEALDVIDVNIAGDPWKDVNASLQNQQLEDSAREEKAEILIGELMRSASSRERLGNIAVTVAASQPVVAETLLAFLGLEQDVFIPKIANKMAKTDVNRAIQMAKQATNSCHHGQAVGAIADRISTSQPERAREILRQAFDVLSEEEPERPRHHSPLKMAVSLLPTVERIDAGLVHEYLFRTLALRRNISCGLYGATTAELGHTDNSGQLRLSDPVLAAAIARFDVDIAKTIAMAPGDTTLSLGFHDAPYFLLGAVARINPQTAVDAVNRLPEQTHAEQVDKMEAWKQVLPAISLDEEAYWKWLMQTQFGVWDLKTEF